MCCFCPCFRRNKIGYNSAPPPNYAYQNTLTDTLNQPNYMQSVDNPNIQLQTYPSPY